MKKIFFLYIFPLALALLIRLVYVFSRKKIIGSESLIEKCKKGPVIIAVYHGDLVPVIGFFSNKIVKIRKVNVLVSPSLDGLMLGRTIKLLGGYYKTGDHRKKPVSGLIKMIKTVRDEKGVPVFAVDGPLGPLHSVRKGVMQCANKCGVPVIAVAANAKKAIRPKSAWDKVFIPLAFTHLCIKFSGQIYPTGDVENDTQELKKTLDGLKEEINKAL